MFTPIAAVLVSFPVVLEPGDHPASRTLSVDVVELVAGREARGFTEHGVMREGVLYLFANAENRKLFEGAPGKFEVADGGACGKMGPLSGLGDARRHAVHDGRVYFFASDSCRESFLRDPSAHIETDDAIPEGTAEARASAVAALSRWAGHAGGELTIRGLRWYRQGISRVVRQGEKDWTVRDEVSIEFPGRFFSRNSWNEEYVYETISAPEGGAMGKPGTRERVAESRSHAHTRALSRLPVVILRGREEPGFVAVMEKGPEGVDRVGVWFHGASSRLDIDRATGRLISMHYRAREGTQKIVEVERLFLEEAPQDGLTLPVSWKDRVSGQEREPVRLQKVEINPSLESGLFRVPAWE